MDDLYPPSPAEIPPGLLVTPTSYWLRLCFAVLAIAGLGLFYAGLIAFLVWHAWFAFVLAPGSDAAFTAALGFVILAMMVAPLLSVTSASPPRGFEVTAETEPQLVAFVHRVADEVGAPRPYRIWLTPDVNAAVFFDVSLLALVFPTRKSLVIGLGLVNQLSLDEIKAVLAHEFGHFAQGSMRVNAWAYVAHQVAAGVVHMRTWIDTALRWLSGIDLRLAWVGWLLRAIAWAIRTCTETLFRGVLRMNRALSREMEFQADLVAARVAGSDSPVAALSRLAAADEALDMALREVARALEDKEVVEDVYAVQTHLIGRLRAVRHEPTWGASPRRPEPPGPTFRVFPKAIGVPPRMYLTHPPNLEREENVKRHYVPSNLDPRPAWALFADPAATRRKMTALLLDVSPEQQLPQVAVSAFCEKLDSRLDKLGFNPRHRGVYLQRPAVRAHEALAGVWGQLPAGSVDEAEIRNFLEDPYPDHLGASLSRLRDLNAEVAMLEALLDGRLEAPGGRVELRGEEVARHQLPAAIERVRGERAEAEQVLVNHDQRVRRTHRLAARVLGPEHEAALVGVAAFLHYVEHQHAILDDEENVFIAVFRQLTLDGVLSSSERKKLIEAIGCALTAMQLLSKDIDEVQVPAAVVARLEACGDWKRWLFGGVAGRPPRPEDLTDEWFQNFSGLLRNMVERMAFARLAALDALLDLEDAVAAAFVRGGALSDGELGGPGLVPARYSALLPGAERAKPLPPGWIDSFKLGIGPFWSTLRAAVALLILGWAVSAMVSSEVQATRSHGVVVPRR